MNSNERKLFRELCEFKNCAFDESLLTNASAEVLGNICANRMGGIAFGRLSDNKMLNSVSREFRNTLEAIYQHNLIKNDSYSKSVLMINNIISNASCKCAMLKGSVLCSLYPKGYRTASDIDLLTLPENVTEIGDYLTKAGFCQGYIKNGSFIPATRSEIIESRMTRGETVPYIKEINMPGMKYLEVDINFSFDYKVGDRNTLENVLNNTTYKKSIQTLSNEDFFIHLCTHLYKEATTLPWIKMKRDMLLYKYCDLYLLLNMMTVADVSVLFDRAKYLNVLDKCAYSIVQAAALFDMENHPAVHEAGIVLKEDSEILHTVIAPTEKKKYMFVTKNIEERFFMKNREADLIEVDYE